MIRQSLIIPVYKNEANVPELLEALRAMAARVGSGFEVVFVVDGSPDRSWLLLREALLDAPFHAQLVRLSRNFGSYPAIRQGLVQARGRYCAVMAADLQEPPELIEQFFIRLEQDGADVIVGAREQRDDPAFTRVTSEWFWQLYRLFINRDIPKGGVDVFGCNEVFRKALLSIDERNSFMIGQIFWLGFRRETIHYKRRSRNAGKSAQTLRRRLRYMSDSLFAFTDLPISILLWAGWGGMGMALIAGIIVLVAKLLGMASVPGYTAIMLALLFLGSLNLLAQGIIGGYVWRVLQNARRRPDSVVALTETFEARP